MSCKNGVDKMGLSCSESCTGLDHLSALIESPGCRAGGQCAAHWVRQTRTYSKETTCWNLSQDRVRDGIKCLFTESQRLFLLQTSPVPGGVGFRFGKSACCEFHREVCRNSQEAPTELFHARV